MRRRNLDPRWITARHGGIDRDGKPYKAGARVFWYPNGNVILTGDAAENAARDFEAARADDEFMGG